MTIRWLSAYSSICSNSLEWEFDRIHHDFEVSAEWTVKGRVFRYPTGVMTNAPGGETINHPPYPVGLLVKTNAIVRKFKHDAFSTRFQYEHQMWLREDVFYKKQWRKKGTESKWMWEAICKPKYKAIVILPRIGCETYLNAMKIASSLQVPVLIYWARYDENYNGQCTLLSGASCNLHRAREFYDKANQLIKTWER